MRIDDIACLARGFVNPSLVDVSTGRRIPFDRRHNTLSFMSAEAMAAAFGGDPSFIPAKIGFIYGTDKDMPMESVITRNQDWDSLLEELSSSSSRTDVDIQVVGFSFHPTLGSENPAPSPSGDSDSSDSSGSDSSEGDYNHILSTGSNAITFHAVSNSQDAGRIRSSVFEGGRGFIYQAVLLARHEIPGKYYILSRVSLKKDGSYLQKPKGFEIALDWTVVFR
jgi:hypothetical protein